METPSNNSRRLRSILKIFSLSLIAFLIVAAFVNIYKSKTIGRNMMGRDGKVQTSVGAPTASIVQDKGGVPTQGGVSGSGETSPDRGRGIIGANDTVSMPSINVSDNEFDVQQDTTETGGSTVEKMAIKTADMQLRVDSVNAAIQSLRTIASTLGGDIYASSVNDDISSAQVRQKQAKIGSLTMKVPADKFEDALSQAKSIARVVVSETTNTQDVASQHFDLDARLKNKKAEEEMIVAILARETNKMSDVLAVTQELARVRGEIERLQSQITYLDGQVDMATLQIMLTEDEPLGVEDSSWRPKQEIANAVNKLLAALRGAVSFLISFFILVLPIILIFTIIFGGILYIIIRKLLRWKNAPKDDSQNSNTRL